MLPGTVTALSTLLEAPDSKLLKIVRRVQAALRTLLKVKPPIQFDGSRFVIPVPEEADKDHVVRAVADALPGSWENTRELSGEEYVAVHTPGERVGAPYVFVDFAPTLVVFGQYTTADLTEGVVRMYRQRSRSALFDLLALTERATDVVTFKGKKGVWRTTHGSALFIPSDGSSAVIPKKGPDIALDKSAAPPAAGGTTPKPESDIRKAGGILKKSSLKQKAAFAASFLKSAGSELTDLGKKYVEDAPWAVARFLSDKEHRDKHLATASEAVKNFPRKATLRLWDTAVGEAEEAKHAISAIGKYATGKKVDDEEKHALKTIATHIGIGITGRALHASGLGLPLAVASGVAKFIAIKALSKTLSKLETAEHAAGAAVGAVHAVQAKASALSGLAKLARHAFEGSDMKDNESKVLSEATSPKQILKFLKLFAAEIASEIKNITPEDLAKITNEVAKEAAKAADKSKKEDVDTSDLSALVRKIRG